MKKILLIVIATIVSLGASAQKGKGVIWETGTLQEALNKAKNNKKGAKPVFLDCYTEWCGPCKYMANTIFPMEEAGKYFNENFVNIKIDMEKGEGPELAKRFKLTGYPTFLILSPDGEEIGRVVGSNELETFIDMVEEARNIRNSVSWLKRKFEKNKSSDNAVIYVNAMGRNSMYSEISQFMNENLPLFNDWDIFSDKMWRYLKIGVNYDNPVVLNYLIENKMEANLSFGRDRVDRVLRDCYSKVLTEYLTGKRTLTKEQILSIVNNFNLIMGDDNREEQMVSNLARWEVTGNNQAITETFKYGNLRDFTPYKMAFFEEIFSKYDCITKEILERYYDSKKEMNGHILKHSDQVKEKIMNSKQGGSH